MKTDFFPLPNGAKASLYYLENGKGLKAAITDFGGNVVRLETLDRDGAWCDVALGFRDPNDYHANTCYIGSLVGRYANRIRNGAFPWDGGNCQVTRNIGEHTLHGGDSFAHRLWKAEIISASELELSLVSPDGDAGYPGELTLRVRYTLTCNNALRIEYKATTTKATPVNFTNHLYFNLAGENAGSIHNQWIQLAADAITETDDVLLPTGKIRPVDGAAYDLRKPRCFRDLFAELPKGFDDNFIFNGKSPQAVAYSPATGIRMEMTTTEPAVQLYTGYFLDGTLVGKGSVAYGRYAGFCLEAQHYPDSPNQPHFPSTRLEPGETYRQTTSYRFSVAGAI